MRGIKKRALEVEVPCALQSYLQHLDKAVKNRDIPPEAREYAFQHWVAFVRCESDDFKSEKFRCPLLGCNHDSDSLSSYLQHITTCPHLKSSQYWCPIHREAETFAVDKLPLKRSLGICIRSGISKAACLMLDVVLFPKLSPRRRVRRQKAYPSSSELESPEIDPPQPSEASLSFWSGGAPRSKASASQSGGKSLAAELEVPKILPTSEEMSFNRLELYRPGLAPSELSTNEPPSELSSADRSLVPELTSQGIPHELPSSNRNSGVLPTAYRDNSLNSNNIFSSNSASIRSGMPEPGPSALPNSRVPGFNTVRPELSTPDPLWTLAEFPSANLTGPYECYPRQPPKLVNVKRNVTGTSGPFSNRRSEPPRLSVVTTQSLRLEHGHSANAAAAPRNMEVYVGTRFDPPSFSGIEDHPQMVGSSGASPYNGGSSSVHSSLFDRHILDGKIDLAKSDDLLSPYLASSALDSPPFDSSAFKSPVSDKDNYYMQMTSESLFKNSNQTPMAPHPLPDHSHLPRGDEHSISDAHEPRTFHPTTPQISFKSPRKIESLDFAVSPYIPMTKPLLQDLIGRVISLHHQCTSTLDPGTYRNFGVFGSSGYSSFKHGLKILRKIYKGTIPRTGYDICALVQVALQFVSYVPSQASNNLWPLVRSDIYRWSLAIEEKYSRDSFLEAMNILWVNLQRSQPQFDGMPHALENTVYHLLTTRKSDLSKFPMRSLQ
ncbi:MAG: hypothetical protein Q9181_006165 [Wetmoreana brouardii]